MARKRSWSQAKPSLFPRITHGDKCLSVKGFPEPGRGSVDEGQVAGERAAEANFGIGESRAWEFGWEHRHWAALV